MRLTEAVTAVLGTITLEPEELEGAQVGEKCTAEGVVLV